MRSIKKSSGDSQTHDFEEILNGDYKPESNDDSQELFKQKQF